MVTNALIAVRQYQQIRSGSGADLNISSDTSGNYTVDKPGGAGAASPYVQETFTIDGTLIGGTTVTHDVTITVGAVDVTVLSLLQQPMVSRQVIISLLP